MDLFAEKYSILESVDAAVAVVTAKGDVWLNSQARGLLGGISVGTLPALLSDRDSLQRVGLDASVSASSEASVYTVWRISQDDTSPDRQTSADTVLQERDRQRDLLVSICLVCAYSEGTLDGIYYAVSETARMLGTDCAALYLADSDSRTWKSICLCTADGENDGYSVRTDIPFEEFSRIEKRLDAKSCVILTGLPEARTVSGEASSVCASRVSAEEGARAVLWLERRKAPADWALEERSFLYVLLGVLKMALRRSRMEKELKEALHNACEANAAKSEFFSSVSHEIRTPMNSILGMTALALDSSDPAEVRSCLERVRISGLYLLGIINDILDISCIEAGKFTLVPGNCSLPALLSEVCDMISPAAEQKGLSFVLRTDDNLPDGIICDEQRMRQVLINLLNNAVKFTDNGYVELCVSADSQDGQELLRFAVTDTGRGIAPEDHNRIFSPYERITDGRATTEGSGLGLRITQTIVDMMDGHILLKSKPGEGSTFSVIIPYERSQQDGTAGADEQTGFSAPQARVLAVDDSEISLMVTCGMLRKFGIEPDTAPNGQAALDRCSAKEYDLILMDHMMPVMDGEAACRRLRSAGINQHTPVVALTANATEAAAELLYSAGMNDILTKPLFRSQLGEKLKKWLDPRLITAAAAPTDSDTGGEFGGLHVEEALERMGSSPELYTEALNLTLPALREAVAVEREMLRSGDLAALRIDSHGLKGVLNTIGAYSAAQLALRVEKLSAAGDSQSISKIWDEYESSLGLLEKDIAAYLEKKGGTQGE